MQKRTQLGIAAAAVVALVGGGAAWATATGDDEKPLSGTARERAVEAALAHTKGGTVTETEIGDDGAAYGVEVRLPNGRHVEVELDRNFQVIGQEADDNDNNEQDDADND